MAKASDNVFPKLIVSEGTTPATPPAGRQTLFLDSADHKWKRVNSAGTVTTIEGGGTGGGSSYPLGSPDAPPAVPNAKDDEFDGTSSVSWTSTPTAPNAFDIDTTSRGCMYVKASGSGAAPVGKYQAVPSFPFTITTKVFSTGRLSFHKAGGILLIPATPTGASSAVLLSHTARSAANAGIQRTAITLGGTFASESTNPGPLAVVKGEAMGARYLRMKVNSATSIDCYCSADGRAWLPVETGFNPGFTPAFMGLGCSEENSGGGVEAYFEFFRVT